MHGKQLTMQKESAALLDYNPHSFSKVRARAVTDLNVLQLMYVIAFMFRAWVRSHCA